MTFLADQASALKYLIEEPENSLCSAYDDTCYVLALSVPFLTPVIILLIYLLIHYSYVKCCRKESVKINV